MTKASNGAPMRFAHEVALRHDSDECLMWPFGSKKYPDIPVGGKTVRVNRYICGLAHGPAPSSEHQAAHWCGNTRCANPRHLRWATCLENMRDKERHGTKLLGERNPKARLSVEDVRLIRSLKGQIPRAELAARFGVTPEHIWGICIRKAWRHA